MGEVRGSVGGADSDLVKGCVPTAFWSGRIVWDFWGEEVVRMWESPDRFVRERILVMAAYESALYLHLDPVERVEMACVSAVVLNLQIGEVMDCDASDYCCVQIMENEADLERVVDDACFRSYQRSERENVLEKVVDDDCHIYPNYPQITEK